MEDVIVKYIGNVGLPGLMCFYLMFVINKSINKLNDTISQMHIKDHTEQLTRIETKLADIITGINSLSYFNRRLAKGVDTNESEH